MKPRTASGEDTKVPNVRPMIGPSIESFGFRLRRVSGSHYIYTHPQVPRPLSLQPRNREAKPYQISQFLDMVREFSLRIEHR
jgi:HicA toxin of bacterial toxin-antitoxin,